MSEIMKKRKIAGYVLVLMVMCTVLFRMAFADTSTAQILELIPDARTGAMGNTFCGVADDVHCLFYNPAGLGTFRHNELTVSNNSLVEGIVHQNISFAYSLRDMVAANVADLGTIAAGITTLDSGDMQKRDINGNNTGTFSLKDQVLWLSYGKQVLASSIAGNIFVGINSKFLTEDVDSIKYTDVCGDVGILWKAAYRPLSAGIAYQNIGPKMRYLQSEYNLPQTIKAGIAYSYKSLSTAIDVSVPQSARMNFSLGTEYPLANAFVIRAGYNSRLDEGIGLTCGIGMYLKEVDMFFMYARAVEINYAFIPYGDLGSMQRISIVFKLGAD
jgi:hypothetical protein